MKKTILILGAMALAILPACQKEINSNIENEGTNGVQLVLNGELENNDDQSKTTIDKVDGKDYAVWTSTDCIRVYDANAVSTDMTVTNCEGTHAKFFSSSVTTGFDKPLYAFYPASAGATYDKTTSTFSFNFPAVQSYKENTFADGSNYALGRASVVDGNYNVKFMNLCGYLKLRLKSTTDCTVTQIELRGNNGEKLNGKFNVNVNSGTFVAVPDATRETDDDVLVLDCGEGVNIHADTPVEFIFVVPAASFKEVTIASETYTVKLAGFIATLHTKEAFDMSLFEKALASYNPAVEIKRSQITALPTKTLELCDEVDYIASKTAEGGKEGAAIVWMDGHSYTHLKVEMKTRIDANVIGNHTQYLVCCANGSARAGYWAGVGENLKYWGLGSSESYSSKIIATTPSVFTIDFKANNFISGNVSDGVSSYDVNRKGSNYLPSRFNTISFLSSVTSPSTYFGANTLYYAKIWNVTAEGDILVGDLVPAVLSDGETYGLYDKVQNRFFGKEARTGKGVIYGPEPTIVVEE